MGSIYSLSLDASCVRQLIGGNTLLNIIGLIQHALLVFICSSEFWKRQYFQTLLVLFLFHPPLRVERMTNLQEILSGYRTNFEKQRLMVARTMKSVKDFIYWFYIQYMLVTCAIDMEPWEEVLMHCLTATTLIMSVFTVYLYIPTHLNHAFQFFLQLVK